MSRDGDMPGEARRGLSGWSAATVLVSAFLLFQVQPMVSKMILPWFGGSPSVWTVCMLFFQAFLLAGYSYAHALERLPRSRPAGLIHLALLVWAAAVLACVPILPSPAWKPPDGSRPQLRILILLATHVGLPYFLLSASAPLIQAWYSRAFAGRVPYRFYALSNVGSLSALLSYPFVMEPTFDLASQSRLWSHCFFAFAILSGGLALMMARWDLPAAHTRWADPSEDARLSATPASHIALWLLLPAFSTLSLLAVTNQICQDVAVVPFLWIAPLSLYLLTFIICFDAERWYRRTLMAVATLGLLFIMAALMMPDRVEWVLKAVRLPHQLPELMDSLALESGCYLAALFLVCMLCHGELVRIRPGSRHLTLFYLMIAVGGVVGGLFVALVCPAVFTALIETDLFLVGGALLAAFVLLQVWWRRTRRWTLWGVLVPVPFLAALALVLPSPSQLGRPSNLVVARRNFYGVLSVKDYGGLDDEDATRRLLNGRILHGTQFRQPDRRDEPTTYYVPESGVGLALLHLPGALRVATVGLGTGTIAAYGREGDYYCFYEINPEVERIAREYFTFLSDCPARPVVKFGDARLSLEQEKTPQDYDVIALDAFSGDAIPAHLLTVEAFAVYRRHLKPSGVIAVHTSNRHLDLAPIVALIARHYGMQVVSVYVREAEGPASSSSEWLLVTNNEAFLHADEVARLAEPVAPPDPSIRIWTDQYSNLFQILKVRDDWRTTWAEWGAWLKKW